MNGYREERKGGRKEGRLISRYIMETEEEKEEMERMRRKERL